MYCSKIYFRIIKINCHCENKMIKVFDLIKKNLNHNIESLQGKDLHYDSNDARYVALYCIKKLMPDISMAELGSLFKRTRTSSYRIMIIIESLIKHDKSFQNKLKLISNELFCMQCIYKKMV